MSIQIYILGKLMQKNTYPYQLKKELSEPIPLAQMANLTESKLYYHFESLSKQGLIQPVEVIKEENRPDKQVFAITDEGKTQLPVKIYELFEKAKSVTDMITGIVFIHLVDREKVMTILQYKLDSLELREQTLQQMRAKLDPSLPYLPVVNFIDTYHAERRTHEMESLQRLIDSLKNNVF